jgi:hypothetical protein|tara:strand:+ start:888 stop:1760 length:873 start_codon:yes stop_codon:yes gene_type:complete
MAFRKIKGSFKNRDITTHVIEDTYLAHDTVTGQLRIGDGVTPGGTLVTTGGGSSLTVQDEGSSLSTSATTLNFVGSGVEVTGDGATKTITISGGGGGSADLGDLQIEGSKLSVQDSSTVGVGIENIRIAGNTFTIDDSAPGFEFDGHLIPSSNATYDLGTPTKRWKTAFLASETIDIGGATISSDGTGAISISATGATLPEDSKVSNNKIQILGSTSGTGARPIQKVKIFVSDGSTQFTDAQLLSSTADLELEFNATVDTEPVYTQAQQTFTLSNGTNLTQQDTVTLFQF